MGKEQLSGASSVAKEIMVANETAAARDAVIEAARKVRDDYPGTQPCSLLDKVLDDLDALQSPLPSKARMEERGQVVMDLDAPIAKDVEMHWADCLRWVADQQLPEAVLANIREQLRNWAAELENR